MGASIPAVPNPAETLAGDTVPLTSEIWEFNVCKFPFLALKANFVYFMLPRRTLTPFPIILMKVETGSFDPMLASFIPTSLFGSFNSSKCFAGFDQASYIAAISSNLFNFFNCKFLTPVLPIRHCHPST